MLSLFLKFWKLEPLFTATIFMSSHHSSSLPWKKMLPLLYRRESLFSVFLNFREELCWCAHHRIWAPSRLHCYQDFATNWSLWTWLRVEKKEDKKFLVKKKCVHLKVKKSLWRDFNNPEANLAWSREWIRIVEAHREEWQRIYFHKSIFSPFLASQLD